MAIILTLTALLTLLPPSLAAPDVTYISARNAEENAQVRTAINAWNTDVLAVNDFLNTVHSKLTDLPGLATSANNTASQFAQNEPTQLGILTQIVNAGFPTAAFTCATNDLAVGTTVGSTTFNFESLVLDVFANIVSDASAGNSDAVLSQVDVVNSYRCCNMLPDLDIIWRDAAQLAGFAEVDVPFTPARPDACGAIDCSTVGQHSTCASESNLVLGVDLGVPGS